MKITIFTSNWPRHIFLVELLSSIAEEVYAVQECNSLFPLDNIESFRQSNIMLDYWQRVFAAEVKVFGLPKFCPSNVFHLPIRQGDLNRLDMQILSSALESDFYVVYGTGYIKGWLCDFLVDHNALNIHMGILPFYRGSACNFWAVYDGHPYYVGSTIHRISKGLDTGHILFHALPMAEEVDVFTLGIKAIQAAHKGLTNYIRTGDIRKMLPIDQDENLVIRNTRSREFTDKIALEYLNRLPSPADIKRSLDSRDLARFIRPYIG